MQTMLLNMDFGRQMVQMREHSLLKNVSLLMKWQQLTMQFIFLLMT